MVPVVRVVGAKGMMAYKSQCGIRDSDHREGRRERQRLCSQSIWDLNTTTIPSSQGTGIIAFGALEGRGNQDGTHPWALLISIPDAQRNICSDVHAPGT